MGKPLLRVHTAGSVGGATGIVAAVKAQMTPVPTERVVTDEALPTILDAPQKMAWASVDLPDPETRTVRALAGL